MPHDGVLQIDTRDPFAAALDHVFRPVDQLHIALRIERGDVAGAKPAILKRSSRARVIVVSADHPGPAHLYFAHGYAIPGNFAALLIDYAQIEAGDGHALLSTGGKSLLLGTSAHAALKD